jgi:hypothetical protein
VWTRQCQISFDARTLAEAPDQFEQLRAQSLSTKLGVVERKDCRAQLLGTGTRQNGGSG